MSRFHGVHPHRPRLMTEEDKDLAMVVRYFLRFGAKGGRDGLTLQVLQGFGIAGW